ncbi:hypothetical protein BCV73_20880 [Paenibacillus sp. SSG-1]|uniref:DUF4340 domain-containing protein n=1 Tax=Paenibacillus cineris TaxID=237530 RepID=A0ABQ4LN00_9BACL|nr:MULTISPECIES: hypothetical protein [Paenibacillus]OXL85274.1 hypothetical protein BCV73_20880 [Paenibacillus sp. SSG-1]UYO07024.1 hypothetical protein K2F33_14820 [Paenibacillus sp. PSB04]GIO57891.1 hypothetical protein J21TS7_62090 [Paenibacillus cineris]
MHVKKSIGAAVCLLLGVIVATLMADREANPPDPARETMAANGEQIQESTGIFQWNDKEVRSVEWEGRNQSWILQRQPAATEESMLRGGWLLNGSELPVSQAESRIRKLRELGKEGGTRRTSTLSHEVIVGTITVTLSGLKKEPEVYLIAVEPDHPEQVWILRSGDPLAYLVSKDAYLELEQLQ